MRIFATVALALLLSGCERDTPQAVLGNYLERVATVLEQPLPDPLPPALTPLPPRRERVVAVSELRAGLLEALDLRLCGLLPLISERNSILGKVKPPSAVMSYEFRFYSLLDACYRRDQQQPLADADFSRRIAEIHRLKRDNLAPTVWNALFTSSEVEHNLSLSRPPLPLQGDPGYGDNLRALQALKQFDEAVRAHLDGQPFHPPDTARIEDHYFALYASPFGSELFSSLALLIDHLGRTAQVLEQAVATRPLCLSGRPIPRARNLKNVFDRYYAGEVQPYMALLQRQAPPWLAEMVALTKASGGGGQRLVAYRQQMLSPDHQAGLWQRYQRTIKRHTDAWQRVLRQCGLMPGQQY